MRYYLDTEFIEDGKTIELISIGLVCEDGREYYAVNGEANISKASDWVIDNVLSQIPTIPWHPHRLAKDGLIRDSNGVVWFRTKDRIAEDILSFVTGGNPDYTEDQTLNQDNAVKDIEFWTYYGSYDWVVFCQLFGTMMDLPKGFPMYYMDIKQWCKQLGDPKLPEQGKGLHNALEDARWNQKAWEFLHELALNRSADENFW